MFSKLLVVMAAAVIAVNAQGTLSASASAPAGALPSGLNLSPCAEECISNAAVDDGCASITDLECVCTNSQFQVDAAFCIQSNCPADLAAAVQLQQQECAAASLSPTGPSATPSSILYTPIPSSGSGNASSIASGASSASASSRASVSAPASASSGGAITSSGPTGSSAASSAASSPTTSSPANSLVANGGVAALVAVIAGFLAI